MPSSLFRNSKPSWFGSLSWPPFDSTSPNSAQYDNIPAGYRYVHGTEAPGVGVGGDTTPPTSPASLTGLTALTFVLRATSRHQAYSVWLGDSGDNPIGNVLSLAQYGGQPVAGKWTVYTVPLKDFGIGSQAVYGVVFQDDTAAAQSPVYLDEIAFK